MTQGNTTMMQDKRSVAQHEAALERIAAKLRCLMFVYGLIMGGILTGLYMHHAYGALAIVIVFTVIWFACLGWPWQLWGRG
jgi:hypothetical protein